MAGAFSNYLETKLVEYTLRGQVFTQPTSVWIALHSADPGEAGGNEITGTGYARVAVTCGTAAFSTHTPPLQNNNTITFPQAGGSWGTATHFSIMDASSSGNMLFYGALTASKAIGTNDTPSFAAAALQITLD